MAQGDVTIFNQFFADVGLEIHQLEADTIKLALVGNGVTPTAATSDPRWGAGGGTDFSAQEVTPGGNYGANGTDVAATYSQTGGVATLDGVTNPSWPKAAGGPTGVYWGILFNDSATGKQCIGFVEIGTNVSNVDSDISVEWAATGIYRTAVKGVL